MRINNINEDNSKVKSDNMSLEIFKRHNINRVWNEVDLTMNVHKLSFNGVRIKTKY